MWTKKGQLFVILGSLSLFGGLFFSNMVLVILGFILLAMVIISAMFRLGHEIAYLRRGPAVTDDSTYKGVKFVRRMSSDQMMEDSKAAIRLYMDNNSKATKRFELMDMAPDTVALTGGTNSGAVTIPKRDRGWLDYEIECPIKGFYKLGPIRVRETDVCQFFYDEKLLKYESDFKVFPNVFTIKEMKLRSRIPKLYAGTTIMNKPGQGMEFYALREYVPGDPYKNINWPAYARTRKLMVNEHQMEAVIELTIILDYRGVTKTGKVLNNPHLSSARAAASLASYFIKRRDKVGLAVYNDKLSYVHREGGSKHLNRLTNHITGQQVKGDMPLGAAVNSLIHDVRKGMPVVIISGLEDDNSAYDAIKRLRSLGCDVILISPTGVKAERSATKDKNLKQVLSLLTIERKARLALIMSLGVKVVDWDIRDPLQDVMAAALGGRWR